MSDFLQDLSKLTLFSADGAPRLRVPQHGCALAIAAHFTARSEAAIVALPTGVGKTAVMTLIPYLLGARRCLVLEPSRLLREQVAEEFKTLKTLRQVGVVPQAVWSPTTAEVVSRITHQKDWKKLTKGQVVVGLPNSISPAVEGVFPIPADMFDLVIVDEAHHSGAEMWSSILEATAHTRRVLFTATPYRRDDLRLPGTFVYEYSMTKALAAGLMAPINLELLEHEGEPDDVLVQRVASLISDEASPYFRVPFIARTDSTKHARDLVKQYGAAGLDVRLVLGDQRLSVARGNIDAVRNQQSAGLVMVGVLGEGFDFPAIKVAAYHRRHKSLPATLQFLGRISRKLGAGPASALVLVPKHEVADETQELYRDDAKWADLVPALADKRFEREAKRALADRELSNTVLGEISASNLHPRQIVDIFVLDASPRLDLDDFLDADESVVQWWSSGDHTFTVFIRKYETKPQWLYSGVLIDINFVLCIICYVASQKLLFIGSDSHSRSVQIAKMCGVAEPVSIAPESLYAILDAQGVEAYYNVGIRNVDVPNELKPAYKINTGPSVAKTLQPGDQETYSLGHAVAKVRVDGVVHSFGLSIGKGRVWTPESTSIIELREWCAAMAQCVKQSNPKEGAPGLNLRKSTTFDRFPDEPVAALASGSLIEAGVRVRDSSGSVPLAGLDIEAQVSPKRDRCLITLSITDRELCTIAYKPNGKAYMVSGANATLTDAAGMTELDMLSAFEQSPFRVYYGDGSSTCGPLRATPMGEVPAFPATSAEYLSWNDVDISKETKTPREGQRTIFSFMHELLASRDGASWIINDDGKDEIADILCVSERGAHCEVALYHCKGAPGVSTQVKPLYIVAGQAIRSLQWTRNRKAFWQAMNSRVGGRFRIVQGDEQAIMASCQRYASAAPETIFKIFIVQPGLAAAALVPGLAANTLLSMVLNTCISAGAEMGLLCHNV